MKKLFGFSAVILSGLFLASCQLGVVGYGSDSSWHRGDRDGYDRGRGGGYHRFDVSAALTPEQQAQRLARDYEIKQTSANTIIGLVNSHAPQADLAALNLDASDLAALQKLQMPSDGSVHKIALRLQESDQSVSLLMQDFIADMKSEARTSDLDQ